MDLTAATALVYVFSSFNNVRNGRSLKRHHVRDMAAILEILARLVKQRFEYGQRVPNGPPDPEMYERNRRAVVENPLGNIEDVAEFTPLDLGFLRRGVLLLVSTRLAMDDLRREERMHSQPGFTSLEQRLFRICRRYLRYCSRSLVELSDELARRLVRDHPELSNRASIQYHQTVDATYKRLVAPGGSQGRGVKRAACKTAAYLLHLKNVAELNGADLVLAFGLGGTQTLAFSYRLRHDLGRLLDRTGLTFVEMTMPESQAEMPAPEVGGDWAMEWSIDHELHFAPVAEDAARERRAFKKDSNRTQIVTA